MIDLIVYRGLGDNPGEDIIDPLITSEAVAILRGTREIDDSEAIELITLETRFRTGVVLGQIASVYDSLYGTQWVGKIVSINHSVAKAAVTTTLDLEKPTNYFV